MASDFWKWTDAQGNLHYTQYPPEQGSQAVIHQRGREPEQQASLSPAESPEPASAPEPAPSAQAAVLQDDPFCQQLDEQRTILQQAKPNTLIERDDAGAYKPLSAETIATRLQYFNTLIQKHCQPQSPP